MIGFEMRLEQKQELTMEQRLEQRLSLRLALLQVTHGEKFKPKGACPGCNKKLTPREIMKGFKQDPYDFTTKCPKCKLRFPPKLMHSDVSGNAEYRFYCPAQTLAKLPGKEVLSPEELLVEHGSMYQSALVHFGTMRAAFKKAGIAYRFKEHSNSKINRFMGKLPDAVIAEYANISAYQVRKMRKKLGIDRWHAE